MRRSEYIAITILVACAMLIAGCATSYEAREEAFMEAIEKARDRPCVPEYVLEAHSELWDAADTDSLQERTVAYADQTLNVLETSCGYLEK